MLRTCQGTGEPPKNEIYERSLGQNETLPEYLYSLHVGHDANTTAMLSTVTTSWHWGITIGGTGGIVWRDEGATRNDVRLTDLFGPSM